MNYKEMSDFELTKRLAELHKTRNFEVRHGDVFEYLGYDDGAQVYQWFDPCNKWQDIMPIAIGLGRIYVSWDLATILHERIDDEHGEVEEEFNCSVNDDMTEQKALVICCILILEK